MTNCRNEFLDEVDGKTVICATIKYTYGYGYEIDEARTFNLPKGYSANTYDLFLQTLDFDYNAEYGSQELFGTIWYDDGTWSERREYNGSEWWSYQECPRIPYELRGNYENNLVL